MNLFNTISTYFKAFLASADDITFKSQQHADLAEISLSTSESYMVLFIGTAVIMVLTTILVISRARKKALRKLQK